MTRFRFAFIFIFFLLVLMVSGQSVFSESISLPPEENELLYLYADTCPVCVQASPEIEAFAESAAVDLIPIDVQDPGNQDLVAGIYDAYDITHRVVPTFVLNDTVMQGFDGGADEPFAVLKEATVETGQGEICSETAENKNAECSDTAPDTTDQAGQNLLGLTGTTVTIGLTDGFNPCSLWALMFLMSMVLRLKDPKAVYLTGAVFILTITAIYGLFIAGTFAIVTNILTVTWLRVMIFLLAAAFALINIRDYFSGKEDLTLAISDTNKKRWIHFSRGRLNQATSPWKLAMAAVTIGLFASVIELPCTAGYPIVWNGLMASAGVGGLQYMSLLSLYLMMYVLVEVVILLLIGRSMQKMSMTNGLAKTMKLVSGTLMLYLAVLLLSGPEAMNNMTLLTGGSLVVIALTLLYVYLARRRA
ncbi:thioredoxin family protein [Salisediminibacterium beveridgei]|uniref:Glutaredoxin n=1 Tax=Salisediminibacterium beveridgei TaxID=632773 RepID=A0A1D7QX94_9BACI|nr:thioredoxin family protein [Salisediminibacterium beveridgei]AOM83578.1 Glutaredoxin [Salisediminibacterium beveridgei]